MTRAGVRLAALLALTPLLAGCSSLDTLFGHVCPAIAWSNVVDVELTGDVADVAIVELCAEGACSVLAADPVDTTPLELAETMPPEDASIPTPAPTHTVLPYIASPLDDDTWKITFDMGSPDRATIRALSSAGEVLAEKDVELEWTRVGGSERCGGPAEAGPVTLDVHA